MDHNCRGHKLKEAGKRLLRGYIIDVEGAQCLIPLLIVVGSDVGWNFVLVKQASNSGIGPVFGKHNPTLETNLPLLLQELENGKVAASASRA